MKKNNKGFTLAELLIVVAIIAVLVAIAIPVFTTQLEKSRDAVTTSNVRAAYAEAAAEILVDGDQVPTSDATIESSEYEVTVKGQQGDGSEFKPDLPFTLGEGLAAALDKRTSEDNDKIKVQFSWDANDKCTANLVTNP